MPVTLAQTHERVVVMTIAAPWTVDELIAVYPKMKEYYDAASQPIYGIVDITKIGTIPAGALRARTSPMTAHENSATIFIVGAKGVAKILADTVFALTHYTRVQFFETEAQVQAQLASLLNQPA